MINYTKEFDYNYLFNLYGENVIASMTDTKGKIIFASKAYVKISGYTLDELIGQKHSIVRHPDMPASAFKELWDTIKSDNIWQGEVLNLKKDGGFYWVNATITPQHNANGKIIGYASIREDITAKKETIVLHKQLENILNNIDEGFLIFNKNGFISKSYSKKCLDILNQDDIYGKNISDILFANDINLKEIFDYAHSELLKTTDISIKNIFISLFPHKHYNQNNIISIKYKLLPNDEILVLIDDVTQQIELENKIKHEQQMQKMIIAIATHKKETIDLKESFQLFLDNLNDTINITKLKIDLHTFKGLFAQQEMLYTTDAIHDIETIIKNNNLAINLNLVFLKSNLQIAFNKDLKIIYEILGENFLSPVTFLKVEIDHIRSAKKKLEKIIKKTNKNKHKEDLFDLLKDISSMQEQPFIDMLSIYKVTIKSISKSINKDMYPLEINGDKKLLISDIFKPFCDSLVHIFRNSMVHGIEDTYTRETLNKNLKGKITCSYKLINGNIILKISDDGQGIDTSKILQKAISLQLVTKEESEKLKEEDILKLIFSAKLSTHENEDNLAGRGVGLASVIYELRQLKGTVDIQNNKNYGLKFVFTLPYHQVPDDINSADILLDKITNIGKTFLSNDMKIECTNIYKINNINLNKHYATVSFNGVADIFFIISFNQKLLEKMYNEFIPYEISAEDKKEVLDTLPNEIVNTIAGLSISKFTTKYKDLKLSEPIMLDKMILDSLLKENLSAIAAIETEIGNFECAIIITKDDTEG